VGNNPINLNDPSGHNPCAGAASGYRCHRDLNKARLESLREDEDNPSFLSAILDRYMLGWENFDSALSTVKNQNASALFKAYSYTYIAGWGGAHAAAAVGATGLACVASGPGCVKVVEGTLGIGASVSADGDPTNEIQAVGKIIQIAQAKLNYLMNSPGKAEGFRRLGYTTQTLKNEMMSIGRNLSPSDLSEVTSFGYKFQKSMEVIGPSNLAGRITSVWQVDVGSTVTRLITAIPEVFK
jgi:hypothetical protein